MRLALSVGAALALASMALTGVTLAGVTAARAQSSNAIAVPPPPPLVAAPPSQNLPSPPAEAVPPGLVQTPLPPPETPSASPANSDDGTAPDSNAQDSNPPDSAAPASTATSPADAGNAPASPPAAATPAGPSAATAMPMSNDWVAGHAAELGILDKVDGGASTLDIPVGGHATSGDLTISVLACMMRPANEIPDAAIFVSVQETADPAAAPIFHGWMVRSIPAATVVGDASQSLRVVNCT